MLANDIFRFDEPLNETIETFAQGMIVEGYATNADEAQTILEEGISQVISRYASRYSGMNPPEIMAYQDPEDRQHVAVLASGDGMFFRFDIINGKVISEERYSSFKEMMDERDLLRSSRYFSIDHRSFLNKNWKKILMWMVGGAAGILLGGPLLLGVLTTIGTAALFIGKVAAGAGMVFGTGWIMSKLAKGEADPAWTR